MSGHKCSQVRLQREREEELRLLQRVRGLHAEAVGLKERAEALLSGASPGLRATFSSETDRAERWLTQTPIPEVDGLGVGIGVAAFKDREGRLAPVVSEGRQIQEALSIAFTQKADEMGRGLAGRLAEVERLYLSHKGVLELWFDSAWIESLKGRLLEAQRQLEMEAYAALEQMLSSIEETLATSSKHAVEQEEKHQRRLYLLKALQTVCAEMGFREIEPPVHEREGDRGSRIIYTVDTLDRGKIVFALSLEGVSSYSETADTHCFEEFDTLSEFLAQEFGIHTEFQPVDGRPRPALKQKEEKALPRSHGAQAQFGG